VPDFPLGPGPKWQTKLGGAIYAPAALHGGIAYVGTAGGLFYAVRTKDGSFVWAFTAGRPIHGEALATDDAIFFVCDDGYLRKLEHGGKEIWRYDLGDARTPRVLVHQILPDDPANDFDFDTKAPRPLLVDGTLYVGSGDGGFHAVDAASGRRVWRFESKDKIRADAASFGELVIFGSFDHHVYALDRATGKEVWNRDVGAKLSSAPAIVGDAVVTGNRGGLLAALDAATGKTRWRMFFWGSSVESDAVPYGDLFYIGSSDMRRVSCIDPTDGQVAWRADVYGCAWSRVAVTEKNVYVGAFGVKPYLLRHLGGVTAVDRASGKVAWRWPMPEWPGSLVNGFAAGPAVDHDVLVIGGLDGCLYAFALA
jgi:outer membrane protein assembly factor BamB